MLKKLAIITDNPMKMELAGKVFKGSGIELEQVKVKSDDLMTDNLTDYVLHKAENSKNNFNKPFLLFHKGFYINSLNGFPGILISFFNKYFKPEDVLKLLDGSNDRIGFWENAVAVSFPGKPVKIVSGRLKGIILKTASAKGEYTADRIFLPEGFNKALSEFSGEEEIDYWASNLCWNKVLKYIQAN